MFMEDLPQEQVTRSISDPPGVSMSIHPPQTRASGLDVGHSPMVPLSSMETFPHDLTMSEEAGAQPEVFRSRTIR